jgi:hypothetical protein
MLEGQVVYFDDAVRDASGNWIGGTWLGRDVASRIAKYFETKSFARKDSSELGKWVTNAISSEQCLGSVLVFAQDVAPREVFDEFSPNARIRQYLDNGGTILWMGDIPFYYRTESKNSHFERTQPIDPKTRKPRDPPITTGFAQIELLGVVPVGMMLGSQFSVTGTGRRFGLRTNWPSLRPIVSPSNFQADRTRITNAICRQHTFIELANVEGIGTSSLQPMQRKGHLKRLLEFLGTSSIEAGPLKVTSAQAETSSGLEFAMKYVSAWIKRFDTRTPRNGFIRVWDYSPRIVTDSMLEELFTLIQRYCDKRQ